MKTKAEQEVFDLLKEEQNTRHIALRRKTSIRAVQKIIKSLKDKGYVAGSSRKGFVLQTTNIPSTKKITRLHGQEFNLKIKFKDDPNFQHEKSFFLDQNRVRIYKKSVEVYSKHSFYANSPFEAKMKSIIYFKAFFLRLAKELKVIFKDIKQVNGHYSEEQNELAKDYRKQKEKLRILAKEDNKTWATIDFSFNEDEFETLHPKTSFDDIEKVKDFFQDIRDKPHYKPSEVTNIVAGIANNQKMFNENLIKHMKVLDNMNKTLEEIRKNLKRFK